MSDQKVLGILARKSRIPAADLRADMSVAEDLKLNGDDAVEAITEIVNACEINASGFEAHKYFNSEPSILSIFKRKEAGKARLTVGDLLKAAETGTLT